MIHPIAESRLATWRPGEPFPCHGCGTGEAMPKRLVCARCDATWMRPGVAPSPAIVPPNIPIVPQFDLFGALA